MSMIHKIRVFLDNKGGYIHGMAIFSGPQIQHYFLSLQFSWLVSIVHAQWYLLYYSIFSLSPLKLHPLYTLEKITFYYNDTVSSHFSKTTIGKLCLELACTFYYKLDEAKLLLAKLLCLPLKEMCFSSC